MQRKEIMLESKASKSTRTIDGGSQYREEKKLLIVREGAHIYRAPIPNQTSQLVGQTISQGPDKNAGKLSLK